MTKRLMRTTVLLALATVAIVVAASAAEADVTTNDKQSLAFAGYVPCANGGAGEILSGTVEAHTVDASTVNGNKDRSQFQFQVHGTMEGAISGDTYRVSGVTRGASQESSENGRYSLTYVNNFHLIGPGPGNDLLAHEIAHVIEVGDDVVVQHDSLSIDCR
jgi:opacity protein-like surface antigen